MDSSLKEAATARLLPMNFQLRTAGRHLPFAWACLPYANTAGTAPEKLAGASTAACLEPAVV